MIQFAMIIQVKSRSFTSLLPYNSKSTFYPHISLLCNLCIFFIKSKKVHKGTFVHMLHALAAFPNRTFIFRHGTWRDTMGILLCFVKHEMQMLEFTNKKLVWGVLMRIFFIFLLTYLRICANMKKILTLFSFSCKDFERGKKSGSKWPFCAIY